MRGCACGCGRPVESSRENARYASDACRARDWKARQEQGRERPVRTAQNGSRSGLQVSYRKARRALLDRLWHFPGGEGLVDEALRDALSDRQRQRLEGR